jgi:hypothetical protein
VLCEHARGVQCAGLHGHHRKVFGDVSRVHTSTIRPRRLLKQNLYEALTPYSRPAAIGTADV